MKTFLFLLVTIFLIPDFANAQSVGSYQVHFAFDQYFLTAKEQKALDQFVVQFRASGAEKIIISGHTDSFGTDEYNIMLSRNRTEVVRQYLQKRGINAGDIQFSSLGEKQPIVANSSDENRQKNRRVEVSYQISTSAKTAGIDEIPPEDECLPRVVEANKGAQVVASCDCFGDIDVHAIKITIKEVNTPAEMIEGDIVTLDDKGNCLQTAGMVFVDVSYNGRPIYAANDSCLKVRIPAKEINPEMQLFRNKTVEGAVGWSLDGQDLNTTMVDGQNYYEFNISGSGGFNCDAVLAPVAVLATPVFFISGIISELKNEGLVVKTRKYRLSRTYLTSTSGDRMDKGRRLTKRKVKFKDCFAGPNAEVMVTLVKDGNYYMVKKPLAQLRYKNFWRKYVIRSKDIEPVTREDMLQAMRDW